MTKVLILKRLNCADPISSSGSLMQAFEILSKRLRDIGDIPLKVSSAQPLDSGMVSSSWKGNCVSIFTKLLPLLLLLYDNIF